VEGAKPAESSDLCAKDKKPQKSQRPEKAKTIEIPQKTIAASGSLRHEAK
jgi:hypothetical protein